MSLLPNTWEPGSYLLRPNHTVRNRDERVLLAVDLQALGVRRVWAIECLEELLDLVGGGLGL